MKYSARLLFYEILAFIVFAVIAAAGFLAWQLSRGPIDLELIRPQVERALANARGGNPVELGALALEWSREHGRVEAAARDLTARDPSGGVAFRADRAVVALDATSLLAGKIKTRRIRLENGRASMHRSSEGVWRLADIVVLTEPSSDKAFDPFRDLNWTTLATPLRAVISAGAFELVELSNFRVMVYDDSQNELWRAEPVNGRWVANSRGAELNLDIKLAGQSEPNRVQIALSANGEVSEARGSIALEGINPAELADSFGLAGESFQSDRPAHAEFSMQATEATGLTVAALSLTGVTGRGRFWETDFDVDSMEIDAAYDPVEQAILLRSFSIDSDRISGSFDGRLDLAAMLAGDDEADIPFELSGSEFDIAVTPYFARPWGFQRASVSGGLARDMDRVTFSEVSAAGEGMQIDGELELWLGEFVDEPKEPLSDDGEATPEVRKGVGVRAEAKIEGEVSPDQILGFWPLTLGASGRSWVEDNIHGGAITNADFIMDWEPGANSEGALPDDTFSLKFGLADGEVSFLSDVPHATDVQASGELRGNSLDIEVQSALFAGWQVDGGDVSLPRFHPGGKDMVVNVSGRGPVKNIMQVLDESRLEIGKRYGLAVEAMDGQGGLEVQFIRPMRTHVPDEDLRYSIAGGFRDVNVPHLAGEFGLSDSDVRVEVDQGGLKISGGGKFGPAPVAFDWSEAFNVKDGDSTQLQATAKVTPDLLNAFGIAARSYMQGEAGVELRASGTGRDFRSIAADVDLTLAALQLDEFGWKKGYDDPAQGVIRYGKDESGAAVLTGDIRSDGVELLGDIAFDADGALRSVGIERIFARDSVDLRGNLQVSDEGDLAVVVAGSLFDARPWMDVFLSMPSGEAGDGVGGAASDEPSIRVRMIADEVRLRDDATLTATEIDLELDGDGPRKGVIKGIIDEGKMLAINITPDGSSRRISVKSDDAGFAARVLLKTDYLMGGSLALDGLFTQGVGDAVLTMNDVRLRDAPLLAQVLSLASLRGLTDVLGGDGVLFSRVDAPVKLSDGRIEIAGLRASGPAIGLTARGWVAPQDQELRLDGVLVPSFGVNSALGGLPIIGDLFVSRQGEGIFSPTYSVRGTFSRARVSINPIAAVTPGMLRRIFENPAEAPVRDGSTAP